MGDRLGRLQDGRADGPVVDGHVKADGRRQALIVVVVQDGDGRVVVVLDAGRLIFLGHDIVDLDRRRLQRTRYNDSELRDGDFVRIEVVGPQAAEHDRARDHGAHVGEASAAVRLGLQDVTRRVRVDIVVRPGGPGSVR